MSRPTDPDPSAPPPLDADVRKRLAEKTPAQRGRLLRKIAECLLGLRAVRAAQRAQAPDARGWAEAKDRLEKAIGGLAGEAGPDAVPQALRAALDLRANHRTAACRGPGMEEYWK
jgi:hypothetical protein